ncbi:hypothetical protein DFH07DRAFT_774811 [Mycena maculata]|uniref:Uncharacterized protein n=1 Tax=Mycena maculata TaxID=230809 RepID=A0AAD7IVX9_9AGAR|nr:hypothetical protein DFH07DRAFT_774811 [Mycena maculata]
MFDFVHSLSESERQRLLRLIRKILDPIERAEATYNLRPYKPEVPGVVYTNYRANHKILDGVATAPTDEEVDWVDLKAGRTNDIDRRRGEYTRDCKGEEIAWAYYYPTNRPKLLVRQRPWSISPCGPDWPTASRIRAMAAGSATGDTDAQAAAHDLFGIAGARDLRRCWRGSYATCTSSRKRGITGAEAAPDSFGIGAAGKHKEARDRILNIESKYGGRRRARALARRKAQGGARGHPEHRIAQKSTFEGTAGSSAADDERGLWRAGKHKEAREDILNIESRAGKHKEARAGILSIESVRAQKSTFEGTVRSTAADDERGLWRAGKHKEAREDILNIESGTTRSTAADDERGLWHAGKHKEARQGILNIESLSCLKSSLESTAF